MISEEDARYAGEHQIPVVTTLSRIDGLRASDPDAVSLVEEEIILPNLRMLRKYNVPVLIGSDEANPVDRRGDLPRPPGHLLPARGAQDGERKPRRSSSSRSARSGCCVRGTRRASWSIRATR